MNFEKEYILYLTKKEVFALNGNYIQSILDNNVIIIKNYYSKILIDNLIDVFFIIIQNKPNKWMKLLKENSPYYYSMEENEKARVKANVTRAMVVLNKIDSTSRRIISSFKELTLLREIVTGNNDEIDFSNLSNSKLLLVASFFLYKNNYGFMAEHNDDISSSPNIIIVTNEKNVNYQAGGLFIVINKMRYNLDKYVNKGDVIILNTHKYTHGVEYVKGVDVSSSNNKLNGRLSLTFSTHKT